jgi:Domain of unknown function (DUF6321)
MPLIKSKSEKAFKTNIKREIEAGKPQKQAVAIAYDVKRHAKKAEGGSLKSIPAENKGLSHLPEEVRHKMGYMKEGGKPGLYANIHAKQERIKHGSKEHMRKPGSKGAPTAEAFKKSALTAKHAEGGPSLAVGRGEKKPTSQGAGLTEKGREKYNRETGSHLKAPQPQGGARKKSFCARMSGVVEHSKGDAPRAKASLRRWKCSGW